MYLANQPLLHQTVVPQRSFTLCPPQAVVLADAAHTKTQPLLHQLADALGAAAAFACEHAVTVQQALSSRMHELLWPGSS